jgi:branched-chain amino acid transport system substrate-binding protein
MTPLTLRLVVAAGMIVAAAGCGDDDDGRAGETVSSSSVPAVTEPVESTAPESTAPPGAGDGVLTIGVLLPQSGAGAGGSIGLPGTNAANLAVNRINEEGGVFGNPVEFVWADEGVTVEEARQGIDELLSQNVDAIVGPGSSIVALEVVDELADAGVVTCSPTASTLALNDYPERDLFFRTIPSDSVIAQAMAQVVVNTGVSSATVVYLDDEYGRPLARLTIERLGALGIDEVNELPFSAQDEDLDDDVLQLVDNPTRSVVIVANSPQGWRILTAIADEFGRDPPDSIILNAPMRTPPADVDVRQVLPEEVRQVVQGVSPSATPNADDDLDGSYSANSFDCVNLIALAAVDAESDNAQDIASEMVNVSIVGQGCPTFGDCLRLLNESRNINYQHPVNNIDLSDRGDPARARVEPFRFDDRGVDVPAGGALTITDPDN